METETQSMASTEVATTEKKEKIREIFFEIDEYRHGNEADVDDICLAEIVLYKE